MHIARFIGFYVLYTGLGFIGMTVLYACIGAWR